MLKLRLLLALSLCCVSLAGYAISEKEQGYINVSSSITKDVDPDKAEVVFYVETSEKTAQEAADKNKTITNNVIDAIKPEIIANEKDSIKTSAFIVRPDYYWTKDNKKVLNSYIATNSVYVITTNIQIQELIIVTLNDINSTIILKSLFKPPRNYLLHIVRMSAIIFILHSSKVIAICGIYINLRYIA